MQSTIARALIAVQLKVNFLLPPEARLLNSVFVLTAEWNAGGDLVRVFPIAGCLDMSSNHKLQRSRLQSPTTVDPRTDCETGVVHQVTQCAVV